MADMDTAGEELGVGRTVERRSMSPFHLGIRTFGDTYYIHARVYACMRYFYLSRTFSVFW